MMFGRSKNALAPPPLAENAAAHEVMRVWAEPDGPQQVALRTTWREPAMWGLLLADAARHAAKAYAAEGMPEDEALDRILEMFRAELMHPTDTPTRIG